MKKIVLILLCLTFQLSAETKKVEANSLQFEVNSEVIFNHKKEGNVYSFQWGNKPPVNSIMLYPSTEGKSKKDIPTIVAKAEKDLPKNLESIQTEFYKNKVTSTKKSEVNLGIYEGTEIKCQSIDNNKKETLSSMIVLYDGSNIWYAFISTNSEKDYQDATKILQSTNTIIKKN